jgi:glycosyltransferase involved in cell wall biosynthesis
MNMNFPYVSVLIPVFNRKEYIIDCIQSALNQTFENFEVVVVDNASDDGTWEVCQQFAALDQRVRIFRNETNIGPVRNWMRCAQEARGTYSKILFSDDCLEPDCLSEMILKFSDSRVALVYCDALLGKSREESIIVYSQSDSSRISCTQFLNLVLSYKAPKSPGAVLIRTLDLLNNLYSSFPTSTPRAFDKNGAGPDVILLLLTSRNYEYVEYIKKPLVFFRDHASSFSAENKNNEIVKGYQSAISFFLKKNYGYYYWLSYLSVEWMQQIRFNRRWYSPVNFLVEFEGIGKITEVLALMGLAMAHLASKMYHRLIKLF